MHIEVLTLEQAKSVYKTEMKKDFPSHELKPFKKIENLILKGNYECLGLFDNSRMLACAFAVKNSDRCVLIDYLDVFAKYRHRGIGSQLLTLVKERYSGFKSILAEVESEEYYSGDARYCKEKRIEFYTKNGFTATDYGVVMNGVRLKVFEYKKEEHDYDLLLELYNLYFILYPAKKVGTKISAYKIN